MFIIRNFWSLKCNFLSFTPSWN